MKPPICTVCKVPFERTYTTMQKTCSPYCAIQDAITKREKKEHREQEKQLKSDRRELRARKVALKTKSQWLADVQNNSFNPFIRERDKDEPCISCGRYDYEIKESFVGGKWDCGHYLSRGAYPELRFEEENAHKQCKSCNGGSGKYVKKNMTVQKNYRINLIEKIGIDRVLWIEGKHEPAKYQIDELIEKKKHYKQQLKLLRASNE